jgi:hypothetical protein
VHSQIKNIFLVFLVLFMSSVKAHEMTPTYPKWVPSHMDGVWKTTMEMFNKRKDVEWYEIGVFDEKWNPVNFVTSYRLFKMPYLSHVKFDVYVAIPDVAIATYICSRSKLRLTSEQKTMVSTRICSRFK